MAHVRPRMGNKILGKSTSAIVAVVGDASDTEKFLSLVEQQFCDLQFDVLLLEDVEPLASRMTKQNFPEYLTDAIRALSPESPIALGTFHAYSEESKTVRSESQIKPR